MTTTLFDRIGGRTAVTAVVDEFYRRVLADELLAPLFTDTDMTRQRGHQRAFLVTALGGPQEYRGRGMRAAHAGRGITATHFAAVAGHLQATLDHAKVGAAEIGEIMTTVASLRDEIVGA